MRPTHCRDRVPGRAKSQAGPLPSKTFEVDGTVDDNVSKRTLEDHASVIYGTSTALRGHQTTVYDAKDPADRKVLYVTEWLYPQVRRENEAKMVWAARNIVHENERALKALPDVVAFKDLADLSTDIIRAQSIRWSLVDTEKHVCAKEKIYFHNKWAAMPPEHSSRPEDVFGYATHPIEWRRQVHNQINDESNAKAKAWFSLSK
ncbi:hypothetical protein DAEQUDRAFT_599799 [Daedalea quercina L-15889]|uniref:Uncharacterized protein n=1 Tax=Daedalea quercina L-15889 TaxID=1314783 RepID=A0A165LN97_9APHY|nr:hypothetical protein DAEQUDRAFT_599799 [Daedalea quercina L-15889]